MSSKLRDALEELVANIEMRSSIFGLNFMVDTKIFLDAKAALAEPLLNCEVGTAEEQYQRWDKYCNSFGTQCDKCGLNCNAHFNLTAKCFACWSQMPYKEGGEA